jgi:hypothetical protein
MNDAVVQQQLAGFLGALQRSSYPGSLGHINSAATLQGSKANATADTVFARQLHLCLHLLLLLLVQ